MLDLGNRLGDALKDRYDVQRELGRGGAAVVFLAEDLKHHREVAIKVMRPELAAALGTERFLREIEIAAGLNHPNILALHDSGEADGLLYFVMPFIEGESLRDRLRREGQLPLDDAVQITCEVGDALSYAHDQGLIHRDIKPENILFQAGHALVSDFGIARAISEAAGTGLTETGMAVGTIAYMSPEQAAGESELDAQTDVYSLGCVLFEMLAGVSPYGGKTPQAVMAQKLIGAVPGVRTERQELPPTVEAVVGRALAKELPERFATAEQLTGALAQAITARAIEEGASRKRRAQRRRSAAWGSVITALVAGWWWWVSTLAGGPTVERLAVLPLLNLGGDPEQDFFVEGAHAAIISELQMAGVGVIARRSVLKYRDTEMPIREITDELGLDAVMEASMTLDGDSVTIDAHLVDGETEEYVWSRTFRTDLRNVITLYRDITRAVAEQIHLTLTPQAEARLAAVQGVDPEAYEAYLKGVAQWHELTAEGLERALQYFEFALGIDPDYALAHAGVAQVAVVRGQMGLIPYDEAGPIVENAARQAVELDSTLAEVHYTLALARWGSWDWAGSEQAFRRAIELHPYSPEMRAYFSHNLFITGQAEEAVAQITRALELDPVDALYQGIYGMDLMYQHRYEEAIEILERALVLEPTAPILLSALRSAYHLSGRYDDAMDAWRASYASTGDTAAVEALNRGFEEGGYAGALGLLAQTMVERSRTTFVTPWRIGTMLTRAGRLDEALDWLERALEAHDPNMPYIRVDPIFDGMRGDRRFQILIEGLNLPG